MKNEDPNDMIKPQVGDFLQLYVQGKKFSSIFFNFNTKRFLSNSQVWGFQCVVGACCHSWYCPLTLFCWCDLSKWEKHRRVRVLQHKGNGSCLKGTYDKVP